jgi:hypothetical protein
MLAWLSLALGMGMARAQEMESPVAGGNLAGGPSPCVCAECCDPCCGAPYFYGGYAHAWLRPHFERNVPVADTNAPGASGLTVFSLNWDHESSPRVWLGWTSECGFGLRATYWEFDHNADFALTEAAGADLRFEIINSIDVRVDGTALADHGLRLRVLDFEGTKHFEAGHVAMCVAGGVRWARMEQSLFVSETGGAETALVAHDFEGLGPTFFIEASRPMGFTGLRLFANSRASLLFGESQLEVFEDNVLNVVFAEHDDLLPIIECQVGAEYNLPLSNTASLGIRAALEGQLWFNAGSGNPAPGPGIGRTASDLGDMGLVGVVLSANLTY